MIENINSIEIFPARFLRKTDEGKFVLRCLLEEDYTEDRIFDEYSLKGIENPEYVLIGVIIGDGYMQSNFTDANEFENIFKKKWKILNK